MTTTKDYVDGKQKTRKKWRNDRLVQIVPQQ